MEEISSPVKRLHLSEAITKLEAELLNIKIPEGRIDLLIGLDYAALLPEVVRSVGNLQLCRNVFGYCISGFHPSFRAVTDSSTLTVQISHVSTSYTSDEISIAALSKLENQFEKMMTMENLGIHYTPRCGNCECGCCPISSKYTVKEERELKLMREGITHDPENKRFTASYPFISNPNKLPNNYYQAVALLKSTEKRLKRFGSDYIRKYTEQTEDMVSRGVARKFSPEEVESYKG